MKLNLGCQDDIREGYINQDIFQFGKVDDVFDFNKFPWKYKDNTFDEVRIWNCLFLAKDFVRFMQEVYRVSKPNAKIIIKTQFFLSTESANYPYNPTQTNYNSFDIFSKEGEYYRRLGIEFKILKRKWVYSENKFLSKLNPLPNLFPKFYSRFLYFLFPSNKIYFELEVIKNN
ncbi:MAG: methyltransferase domain-containing protein [Nanoarchaeota archaeon]